jgi:hypothetical protein
MKENQMSIGEFLHEADAKAYKESAEAHPLFKEYFTRAVRYCLKPS